MGVFGKRGIDRRRSRRHDHDRVCRRSMSKRNSHSAESRCRASSRLRKRDDDVRRRQNRGVAQFSRQTNRLYQKIQGGRKSHRRGREQRKGRSGSGGREKEEEEEERGRRRGGVI